jgi:apolipoprotein N-acyltransferase
VFALVPDSFQVYHKLRPVPFEEVIPFQKYLPWVSREEFLSPGLAVRPLRVYLKPMTKLSKSDTWWVPHPGGLSGAVVELGPSVCFEVAFHDPARQQVQAGADVHLVVTNDAWFGYSLQPFQHLNLALLRAVETRRSVIFCANSGFSAIIDHLGRINGRSRLFERGVISGMVPVNDSESVYLALGDWVALVSFAGILVWMLMLIFTKISGRTGTHSTD